MKWWKGRERERGRAFKLEVNNQTLLLESRAAMLYASLARSLACSVHFPIVSFHHFQVLSVSPSHIHTRDRRVGAILIDSSVT